MRSAARGSPCASPRSASTTPTSDRPGKLWPLATSCVPTTMSTSPRAIASSSARSRCVPPSMSLDMTSVRAFGKRSSTSSCRRSTPGPKATRLSSAPQFGQVVRPPLLVAAMVADEDAAEAMLDQPGRAVRAGHAVAAGAAERQRRVAAAVEEEQRLLAAARSSPRPPATSGGESQRPRSGGCCLQVDRRDFRRDGDAEARRQAADARSGRGRR